ncbi:MAG: NAD(+) diphosphatase [Mangrovicoccus sp.]|nr:NAD(+) diphosphatase [Mangrovicoccus sp.]
MLERAAHLRTDQPTIDALWRGDDARCVAFWRNKPLLDLQEPEKPSLVLLPTDHPLIAGRRGAAMFLGLAQEAPVFAVDLSDLAVENSEMADAAGFLDFSTQSHAEFPQGSGFAELRGVMTRLTPLEAELAATGRALSAWHQSHGFCANCGAQSHQAAMGWQRDCPSCGANHYPRTDPVVIVLALSGNRVLVGRSPGWPEGMYSLLAGFVEPGEPLEAAAKREVFEEAGVRLGPVRMLYSQPWPFPASLMVACIAEAESEEITVDPAEIEDARWVSREEMVEVMGKRHPEIMPARRGAIARSLIEDWLADRIV